MRVTIRAGLIAALVSSVACAAATKEQVAQAAQRVDVEYWSAFTPSCTAPQRRDRFAPQRAACEFGPGARVAETLDISSVERSTIPIDHVILVMKENRSFDHYLGRLHELGQPDAEPIPADFTNLDDSGRRVKPHRAASTCLGPDPDHQWQAMHAMVNGGKMDGFVRNAAKTRRSDGHYVMGYYDDRDLPFYYFLANAYAVADRHFASVRSGTWPNRAYLMLGTSDGVRRTGGGHPSPALPTIFSQLEAARASYGVYSDGEPLEGTLDWRDDHAGVAKISAFFAQLADGSLPQVAFIDGEENVDDEHPTANVQLGEAWTRRIYQAARESPLWSSLAMIWTYEEGGGFFDHVPPPNACVARPEDSEFFELGVRLPLVVVSPWARQHYVSHVQHEHTSILRFIQVLFDLPALTARDANSDALLDMFDFTCPLRDDIPDAPPAGRGGCELSL